MNVWAKKDKDTNKAWFSDPQRDFLKLISCPCHPGLKLFSLSVLQKESCSGARGLRLILPCTLSAFKTGEAGASVTLAKHLGILGNTFSITKEVDLSYILMFS